MKAKPKKTPIIPETPVIYEINTAIWLKELRQKYQKRINLTNIPAREYDELASLGFNAIWLMGVWKRSTAGLAIAKEHDGIMKDLREALPDLEDEDIIGSPYCIRDYHVDTRFGGDKGLANARKELKNRGMKLILDFVPNHVAPDHPWTKSNPEFFIKGTKKEMDSRPEEFYQVGKNIYARARDPFYPPWPDVLQLNVFNEKLIDTLTETLKSIADQCDGIRCDMAMLVMKDIFAKTWTNKAKPVPKKDFWNYVIPSIKKKHPDFVFIAESYWDTEPALLKQGFDYCYDKKYCDFLKEGAEKSANHLTEMAPHQQHLLRFLENHDEHRAAYDNSPEKNKALAMASLSVPGAKLFHEGQLSGRTVKVPVFLSRRQAEVENRELMLFYRQLLKILKFDALRLGEWSTCEVSGWHDNQSCQNLLAWEWVHENEKLMIVINLSDQPAQAHLKSNYLYRSGITYQLFDVIVGELYLRDGDEMNEPGLYVVLKKWGIHVFLIEH